MELDYGMSTQSMYHHGSARRFEIHPTDPRDTAGNGPLRTRDRRLKLSKEQARLRLGAPMQKNQRTVHLRTAWKLIILNSSVFASSNAYL